MHDAFPHNGSAQEEAHKPAEIFLMFSTTENHLYSSLLDMRTYPKLCDMGHGLEMQLHVENLWYWNIANAVSGVRYFYIVVQPNGNFISISLEDLWGTNGQTQTQDYMFIYDLI